MCVRKKEREESPGICFKMQAESNARITGTNSFDESKTTLARSFI